MSLFVIGDLHLSLGCDKPMDIFKGWEGYTERLKTQWLSKIQPEDTVVLAGDTSWSMALTHCKEDFLFLHQLPGEKILLKGNHDYWWTTVKKMNEFLSEHGLTSLRFLHNNAYEVSGFAICGTRGWMIDQSEQHDVKILERESGRLGFSLAYAEKEFPLAEKIAFLHYPPLQHNRLSPHFVDQMKKYGVRQCFYGHLHGYSIHHAIQGQQDDICYRLISADALGFSPLEIKPCR